MFELHDIEQALAAESRESITQMVTMTWHHQWRGRLRVPHVMDTWQGLMNRWLAHSDKCDAARLIQLIAQHRLKDGDLPADYDPDYAERMCRALVRSKDEIDDRRMMFDLGMAGTVDGSFGTTVKVSS